MADRKVLFYSGSIGLGHVTRDLAIVQELRKLGSVEVLWLAASPADGLLADAGERVLPESQSLVNENAIAEDAACGGALSLIKYAFRARTKWMRNVEIVDRLMTAHRFDLMVGDETYEVALAYKRDPSRKKCPLVMIYDFVGFTAMSASPLEKLGVWIWNSKWAKGYSRPSRAVDKRLFVGELEDIPDTPLGWRLPSRREWARSVCTFIGYVLPFDPASYADRGALRLRLGYGDAPLVICALGGTAIGKELLELCGRAFPIAKASVPQLKMVLVCGPRLDPATLAVPEGVQVVGYVPDLFEHLAACDLAVVQGGGSVTLELTALRRPFIYFPIEGHCEQEVYIAHRLQHHGAGVRMNSRTSASALADAMVKHLGASVVYPSIRSDGAQRGARAIGELLGGPQDSLR